MTFSEILIVCVLVLFVLCFVVTWKLIKFSMIILEVEDAIDECVEVLDDKYRSIGEVLEMPVFFDSVEVRQVIADIRACHSAVLVVANKLTKNAGTLSEIKEENKESQK